MFNTFVSDTNRPGGNGNMVFRCTICGALITYSDRLLTIDGKNRHQFTNPAGVECDFHTFYSCPGAIAVGEPTDEHTWFSGYWWRIALCRECGQHIGWFYEAVSRLVPPWSFWGILISQTIKE